MALFCVWFRVPTRLLEVPAGAGKCVILANMRTALLLFATLLCLAAADVAGTYKGSWSGAANGDFRLKLEQSATGDWKADIVFTMGTDEVKTKTKSVKVDGSKVDIIYDFDLQGNALESAVTGQLTGKIMEGTYKTKTVADGSPVDEGTWKVSAQE